MVFMATHATRNVVVMVPHVMWLLVNAIVLLVLCHPLVLTVSALKSYKLVLSSESFRNNYHRKNVFEQFSRLLVKQGWRSGESTRLPPNWPGFRSWRQRHMWVEFVVGSFPCSERFFSGYPCFLLSSKANTSKF